MTNLIKFGNAFQYGIDEFICDEEADVKKLPVSDTPGSRALVITSGNVYYLNSKHQWIKRGGASPTPPEPPTAAITYDFTDSNFNILSSTGIDFIYTPSIEDIKLVANKTINLILENENLIIGG